MNENFHRGAVNYAVIRSDDAIFALERKYRLGGEGEGSSECDGLVEAVPLAVKTSYEELIRNVFPDRTGKGFLVNPVLITESFHRTTLSKERLARQTYEWLKTQTRNEFDILSVSAKVSGQKLSVVFLLRMYGAEDVSDIRSRMPEIKDLFVFLGESGSEMDGRPEKASEDPHIPEKKENARVDPVFSYQSQVYLNTSNDIPFLNKMESFTPEIESCEYEEKTISVSEIQKRLESILPYEKFSSIFEASVSYLTSVEKNTYIEVLDGSVSKQVFDILIDRYLFRNFVQPGDLPVEDVGVMKQRINNALFDLYLIQDLISFNPEITDIHITAPDAVRFTVYGKSYLSDIRFIDDNDYYRFFESLAIRNRIDRSLPNQTFVDERDPDYVLRITLTAGYISSTGYPFVHIRKVPRKKKTGEELIRAGMFDEKIMNYLIECGRKSRGIIFSGAPGSGKTTILNWALDAIYEPAANMLVIQESDELTSERKGVMFEHVVRNPRAGELKCSLEDLGQLALVAGAQIFVIGEVKGAEICSAITLANSGCRTAMTIHSPSAKETVDKMTDLAMRGWADSYESTKRMLKAFQTIVYVKDFSVDEITEIVGYDEVNRKMIFKNVYKKGL